MAKVTRNIAKHLTIVFIGTFIVAAVIDFGSELFVSEVSSLVLALFFLLFIILLHIIFDIVAVAVMSAEEAPFHAKAANKVRGSGQAVRLIRNADLVANICADVVGDVTGTISGALAAGIALDILRLIGKIQLPSIVFSTVFLALVASLTVTGKAWGKTMAVSRANEIVFYVGKLISWLESSTGIRVVPAGKQRKRGKKA